MPTRSRTFRALKLVVLLICWIVVVTLVTNFFYPYQFVSEVIAVGIGWFVAMRFGHILLFWE